MKNLKYTEILKSNRELVKNLSGSKCEIVILSNVITSQLNEILEYSLRKEYLNVNAKSGYYDNIPQDSKKFKNSNTVIIFWELANIVNGLQYKANLMDNDEIESLLSKVKAEIDFVLMNLKETSLVLINKFSSLIYTHENIKENNFDKICQNLNRYLEQKAQSNMIVIDIDRVIAEVSVQKSVDFRFYYSSRVLYSIDFYKNYTEYIKPIILAANGKAKKAIIFDCDNTMWKGILGEDGFDGIEMSSKSESGAVFEEVQYMALELNRRGILLGFCSKNNPQDVDKVIASHPDMKIRDKCITIKKVNWDDKVANLKAIARELNIGLDSLVFLEDSDFEVNYVREFLPNVTVLQVPAKLHEYPKMLRANMGLFHNLSESKEDLKKTEMYKQQAEREQEESKFRNLDDYLKSLELKLTIYCDDKSIISRMSQMTHKTNQFNLTTKRYTEPDMEKFAANDQHKAFAFSVRDKFGDYGITGLCIAQLNHKNKSANIDTFLMSCRVIGRNIEVVFFNFVADSLRKLKFENLYAKYIKTLKNTQVANFYDNCGLRLMESSEDDKVYSINLSEFKPRNIKYIKVNHGK